MLTSGIEDQRQDRITVMMMVRKIRISREKQAIDHPCLPLQQGAQPLLHA